MPRLWIQIAMIITAVVAVYQHAHQGQFMMMDDGLLVFENPIVQKFDVAGAFSTYDPELYIPLTLLSYQLEFHFFGANPTVFHVTNVLLHMLNSVLVLLLVRFWTTRWSISFFTALLFAVHPINTEAVLLISARKDVLSAAFFLGSCVTYCYQRRHNNRLAYYISVALFFCSLLAKVSIVMLPLMLIILDDILPRERRPYERLSKWAYYLPAMVFLAVGMLKKFISVYTVEYSDAALIAIKGAVFYLQKILLPTDLSMFYKQPFPIEPLQMEFILPACILVLLGSIVLASRQLGKAFSFGILWFGIAVLPNSANASKGDENMLFFASDRYAYIAAIGIFFLVSMGLMYAWDALRTHRQRAMMALCIACIPLLYGITAYRYSIAWLTPGTYMRYIISRHPNIAMAYVVQGIDALNRDNLSVAASAFSTAINLSPDNTAARTSLGLTMARQGHLQESEEMLRQVILQRVSFNRAYIYLAFVVLKQGDDKQAEHLLHQALANNPESAQSFQLLGIIEHRRGNLQKAEAHLRTSIALDGSSIRTKASLATLLRQKNS